MAAQQVLRALSALSPRGDSSASGTDDIVWLGNTPSPLTTGDASESVPLTFPITPSIEIGAQRDVLVLGADGKPDPNSAALLSDVAARARLNGRIALRVAWLTAVGLDDQGALTFTPILQTLAALETSHLPRLLSRTPTFRLRRVSDWSLAIPVDDPEREEALLDAAEFGGMIGYPAVEDHLVRAAPKLRSWILALSASQGWNVRAITGAHPGSVRGLLAGHTATDDRDVVMCVGFALLINEPRSATGRGASLLAWSDRSGIDATAFSALVTEDGPGDEPDEGRDDESETTDDLVAHVPVNMAQRNITIAARNHRVTVVSGAPGTGKTHTIAAICADAVARGESVLIGTRTLEAASVIGDLLHRQPGPEPLRFGAPDQLQAAFAEIERRLAKHETASGPDRAERARSDHATLIERVSSHLADLAAIDAAGNAGPHAAVLRASVPGLFEPDVDLDELAELLEGVRHPRGWFGTSIGTTSARRKAAERVASIVGAPCQTEDQLDVVAEALTFARGLRRLTDAPALARQVEEMWPSLEDAERELRYWVGQQLDRDTIDRLSKRAAREALATISTALRSGPTARQRLLAAIDPGSFRDAAPLWLGTLGEIDRLLPPVAGFFDLVVIDEASQVDLALAAPALLRAERCVVLGDSRQLRHVSFVSDADAEQAFDSADAAEESARLDVRRNSVFDVAAGVAPVQWLDEHHRSLPHLVEFSIHEFYDRAVQLATRFPTTECRDCIEVLRAGDEDTVRQVITRLRELARQGADDVGVVTPLRAVAESLREAAIIQLGPATIASLNLMITTVHGFQGAERQHVIVVPGIDQDSPTGRRRFVEDPHLFNVMVSRARRRMDVVTSIEPDNRTLLGRFIAWSLVAPPPCPPNEPTHPSAAALGDSLGDAGISVRYRYPVGVHRVDVVAQLGERVVGIMCGVHPDGPRSHVERHLALRRAGWRLVDLVPVLDDEAMAAVAIEVAGDLGT